MARRSCPLEGFEQCDTVPDGLNRLNRRLLALPDSWDPAKLDLFSKSRLTKHCKRAIAGFHFKSSRKAWRFKQGDRCGGFLQAYCSRTELTKQSRRTRNGAIDCRVALALQFQGHFILLRQFNFGMASLERVAGHCLML